MYESARCARDMVITTCYYTWSLCTHFMQPHPSTFPCQSNLSSSAKARGPTCNHRYSPHAQLSVIKACLPLDASFALNFRHLQQLLLRSQILRILTSVLFEFGGIRRLPLPQCESVLAGFHGRRVAFRCASFSVGFHVVFVWCVGY